MKNQNKANAGRTQIADISVAGKELSEEHLRIVGGGTFSLGSIFAALRVVKSWTNNTFLTCTFSLDGDCKIYTQDHSSTEDINVAAP